MEKARENNNMKQGSCPEVISEKSADNLSSGSDIVPSGSDIKKIFYCNRCKKGFPTFQALGGHQNKHKRERDLEKERKEMEAKFPGCLFIDKPHLLLCGHSEDALSNENHLGITLDPPKLLRNGTRPYCNSGVTRGSMNTNAYDPSSRAPYSLSSHNNIGFLNPRNVPLILHPQTTNPFRNSFSKNNVLKEQDLISKVGMNNSVVQINDVKDDEDDEPKRKKIKEWGLTLSL